VQRNLVILREEVLLYENVGEVVFTVGEDQPVEEVCETFVVNEVGADAEGVKVARFVGKHAVDDCLESRDPDSVVSDVKEVQLLVLLESFTQRAGTVNIDYVAVKVECLNRIVRLEGLAEALDARDAHLALRQIEEANGLVVSQCIVEELATFLVQHVLRQVQMGDLALADRVLADCISKQLHRRFCQLAVV